VKVTGAPKVDVGLLDVTVVVVAMGFTFWVMPGDCDPE
jgi:hypothetical protein